MSKTEGKRVPFRSVASLNLCGVVHLVRSSQSDVDVVDEARVAWDESNFGRKASSLADANKVANSEMQIAGDVDNGPGIIRCSLNFRFNGRRATVQVVMNFTAKGIVAVHENRGSLHSCGLLLRIIDLQIRGETSRDVIKS